MILNRLKVTLFLTTAVVATSGCNRLETPESEYGNYREVIEDRAIERGWVPSFLPESATEIRERHDLDTNRVWVRFHVDPAHFESLAHACRGGSPAEVRLPGGTSREIAWWPSDLVGPTPPLRLHYYRCDKEVEYPDRSTIKTAFLAIDVEAGGVFYWAQ